MAAALSPLPHAAAAAAAYRCALYSFWCWWWTCRLVQLFYCWPLLIEWVAFSARPSGHLCSFIVLINQSRLPIVLAVLVRVLYTSTLRGVVNPTILYSTLLVSKSLAYNNDRLFIQFYFSYNRHFSGIVATKYLIVFFNIRFYWWSLFMFKNCCNVSYLTFLINVAYNWGILI